MGSRSVTIGAYLVLVLALLLMIRLGRRRPEVLAPLVDVVRYAARTRAGQLLFLLAWWWLGWHFLVAT